MITSGSERICLDERRHAVVLAGPFVRALGLAVVGIGCMAIGWPATIAGVVLQLAGAGIALRAVWMWERTRVVLTTEKLFVVHGTFHRRAAAVYSQSIDDVNRKISTFNQTCPIASLMRWPLSHAAEMKKFEERVPGFLTY